MPYRNRPNSGLHLSVSTPLAREAAACASDHTHSRRELYRLLLQETVYIRTNTPVIGSTGWRRLVADKQIGFLSLRTPTGSEYLPIYDHPNRLKAAARQLDAERPVHYIALEGRTFWELDHPAAIAGVLLNPGQPDTLLIGRFDMDILAAGICPGDLETAISEGEPIAELLQNHPLLVPCKEDGSADITLGEDGIRRICAFSSTDAFAAHLSEQRPTHLVCKPGSACIEEAVTNDCLLVLNPEGPGTCSLNPSVVWSRSESR